MWVKGSGLRASSYVAVRVFLCRVCAPRSPGEDIEAHCFRFGDCAFRAAGCVCSVVGLRVVRVVRVRVVRW